MLIRMTWSCHLSQREQFSDKGPTCWCESKYLSLMTSPYHFWWRYTLRRGLMGLGATEVTVSLSNCPLATEHAQCAHHSPGRCLVPVPGLWLEIFLSSLTTDSARPVQPSPAKLMSLNVCYLNLTRFLKNLCSAPSSYDSLTPNAKKGSALSQS